MTSPPFLRHRHKVLESLLTLLSYTASIQSEKLPWLYVQNIFWGTSLHFHCSYLDWSHYWCSCHLTSPASTLVSFLVSSQPSSLNILVKASDYITPLLEISPRFLVSSRVTKSLQQPTRSGLFTSLISSPTFCFLIYSVPAILVSLLFNEQPSTLPQRDFILPVSSTWNALPQISARKFHFSLFLLFFFFFQGKKFLYPFRTILFQIVTLLFLDTLHPVSLLNFFP